MAPLPDNFVARGPIRKNEIAASNKEGPVGSNPLNTRKLVISFKVSRK